MKIFILLLLASSLCYSQTSSDPDLVPVKNYDVTHYTAYIDFRPGSQEFIKASNTYLFEWTEENPEGTEIEFHAEGLDILGVYDFNGDELDFSISNEDDIELKSYFVDYTSDTENTGFVIEYEGTLTSESYSNWGGVHSDDRGEYSVGVGFRNPYVSSTRHWLPCFDHPSDKATYELFFATTGTLGLKVASIGKGLEIVGQAASVFYKWETEIPTASYLVSFYHGDFETTSFDDMDIPNEVYHLESDQDAVNLVFSKSSDMVAAFEAALDEPYPFEKLGHYIMERSAAMEHQTLIAIGESRLYNYYNNNDSLGSTIAHEIAHQWFGNLVSPASFSDAWLNESFATLCEALFYEEYYQDETEFWKKQKDIGSLFFNGPANSDGQIPIVGYDREESTNYPGTIYYKGAAVLGMLRHKIGNDVFRNALHKYIDKFKFGNATTRDALDVFEEESGLDLTKFWDEWIFGIGWPVLSYRFNTEGADATIIFEQMQADIWQSFSEMEIPIEWEDFDGNTKEIVYQFKGENDKAILGENVNYSTVRINVSDSLYTLLRLIRVTKVELNNKDLISVDNKNGIITILDETFSCPKVSLINIKGQEIYKESNCNKIINTNGFDRGLYFLKLEENSKVHLAKIILN